MQPVKDAYYKLKGVLQNKRSLVVIISFVLILAVIVSLVYFINKTQLDNRSQAGLNCTEPITILTSLDGKRFEQGFESI